MGDVKKGIPKMFMGIGKNLAEVIASQAFEFWQRKDFRLYVEFDKLSQTEQDRLFNELEVSVIGLFVIHLDNTIEKVDKRFIPVLQVLQREITLGFVDLLSNTGIDKQYVKQWTALIDMRLQQYREDFQTALKESEKMKEFKGDKELRSTWAVIETITIDGLTHIRKGDMKEDDPLWKLLRKWLITLDTTIMHRIAKLAEKS